MATDDPPGSSAASRCSTSLEPCSLGPHGCHNTTYTRRTALTKFSDISTLEQNLICLRSKRERQSVNNVCAHHFYLYIFKYTSHLASKCCVNPFGVHKKKCRGKKRITQSLSNVIPSLVPGDLLCPKCYIHCSKMKSSTREHTQVSVVSEHEEQAQPKFLASFNRSLAAVGETPVSRRRAHSHQHQRYIRKKLAK